MFDLFAQRFDGASGRGGLLGHLPDDHRNPLGPQLVADWHAYNGVGCGLDDGPRCWRTDDAFGPGPVADRLPLVAGVYGRSDCKSSGLREFYDWMDSNGAGYLAWARRFASDTSNELPPNGPSLERTRGGLEELPVRRSGAVAPVTGLHGNTLGDRSESLHSPCRTVPLEYPADGCSDV